MLQDSAILTVRLQDRSKSGQSERTGAARAALLASLVIATTIGLVAMFDVVLSARERAGSDYALRLSVLFPYIGVGGTYVFARALGLSALVLAGTAVAIGLERGRRRVEGAPASAFMLCIHRQIGLVTIALVAAHAAVPYASVYSPYGGWATALIPFAQPFSWGLHAELFESFGIIAFYLLIVLGPTYYFLRRRPRMWSSLHALTVAVYGLCVLHSLFLGSDFIARGPARVALIASQVPITLLLARRLWSPNRPGTYRRMHQVGASLAVISSAALVVLAAFGIAGASLGGFPL